MRSSAASLAIALTACSYAPQRVTGDVAFDGPPGIDAPPAEVWLDGWSHRKPILLLASAIVAPSTGLADFPVMISADDPEIAGIALADGTDLAFTAGDGETRLAHEIEEYAAGVFVAWVKIPMLLDVDTRLYVYYGNASPPPPAPQQVWTADFLAVYHLNQDPGPDNQPNMRDATSAGRHGIASSTLQTSDRVPGQVGRGIHLDGSDQYITVGTTDVGNAFTISTWMNVSTDNSIQTLLANSGNGNTTDGWRFFINSSGERDYVVRFEVGNGLAITPPDAVAPNQWHHVAAVVNRTAGTAEIFVDGVFANPADTSITTTFNTNSDFAIGRMENSTNEFGGTMDEVEIAAVLRPAEWLQTSHANQRSPSTFFTLGPQEALR